MARHEGGRAEVLIVELSRGEKALPVFSYAEEASLFVGLAPEGREGDGRWRVWETEAGELARVLRGPCRGVGRVALDPLPEIGAEPLNRLASTGRERFVRILLDREASAGPRR